MRVRVGKRFYHNLKISLGNLDSILIAVDTENSFEFFCLKFFLTILKKLEREN